MAKGSRNRTSYITESNDTSSRSHAICQIVIKDACSDDLHGKLSLIDLAGAERGHDIISHDRQVRVLHVCATVVSAMFAGV
jgi:kinesin family member 2/24